MLWLCSFGDRKGIRPVKSVGCWFVWSFARFIAPAVTTASIVLSSNKTGQARFSWKMAVKTQRECVWVISSFMMIVWSILLLCSSGKRERSIKIPSNSSVQQSSRFTACTVYTSSVCLHVFRTWTVSLTSRIPRTKTICQADRMR